MQIQTNQGLKHYGFYRGQVVRLESYGACKIWIAGVYPEEYSSGKGIDNLPDAEQASLIFGGCTEGNGMFSYPALNSIVWCFFQNGDQNYPVYFAATYGGDGVIPQSDNPDPNSRSYPYGSIKKGKDDDGNDIAQGHIINSGGVTIDIRETGQVFITCTGQTNQDNSASISIDGESGTITINATNQVNINSKNISINGTDTVTVKSDIISESGTGAIKIHSGNFEHHNNLAYNIDIVKNMEMKCGGFSKTQTMNGTITS